MKLNIKIHNPFSLTKSKKVLGASWKLLNSNIVLLIITLIFGNFYIPFLLSNWQSENNKLLRAEESQHSFNREILAVGWKRLFLAKNFYWVSKDSDFVLRKQELWNEYYESTKEWNINLVTNIALIRHYYGDDLRILLENDINIQFVRLHDELLDLKNGNYVDESEINEDFEHLTNRLYVLSEKLNF